MNRYGLLIIALLIAGVMKSQKFEPKWVGEVVILNTENDTIIQPTEKSSVKIKTKQSAGKLLVGIGNIRQKVYVEGAASPIQLNPDSTITLIVKCKNNENDPSSFIQIIKFEKGKKERRTELANINWLGNTSEGNMQLIPFEADVYGKSSYILTMAPQEGEFGVRILNPNDRDEKVPIFYCFGTSNFGQTISSKVKSQMSDSPTKDGTEYEYKGLLRPVYKNNKGQRFILLNKDERVYLPDED